MGAGARAQLLLRVLNFTHLNNHWQISIAVLLTFGIEQCTYLSMLGWQLVHVPLHECTKLLFNLLKPQQNAVILLTVFSNAFFVTKNIVFLQIYSNFFQRYPTDDNPFFEQI